MFRLYSSLYEYKIFEILFWKIYWQANNIRIAVAVMFPGDLLQHPTTPVQNAENIARKPIMNRAITDLPISRTIRRYLSVTYFLLMHLKNIFMTIWKISKSFNYIMHAFTAYQRSNFPFALHRRVQRDLILKYL